MLEATEMPEMAMGTFYVTTRMTMNIFTWPISFRIPSLNLMRAASWYVYSDRAISFLINLFDNRVTQRRPPIKSSICLTSALRT